MDLVDYEQNVGNCAIRNFTKLNYKGKQRDTGNITKFC